MNGLEDTLTELITAKQWKQALNLCEKKIKKSPSNDYLSVTRIKILLSWNDAQRSEQGLKDLENLLKRKPPVTDIEALRALDGLFLGFKSLEQLTPAQKQTWQRAANSHPLDENLHSVWYRSKFQDGDYRAAQQASMTWMKNFPKDRKPFYFYIINTHLVSVSSSDDSEKGLMRSLAYKYLSKAAAESDGTVTYSGRQIETMEDRSLLLRIYRTQGKYKEAIDLMLHSPIGLPSLTGGTRWYFMRQYMDILELAEQWKDLYEVCRIVLRNSRKGQAFIDSGFNFGDIGDDWKVWQLLVKSGDKVGLDETSLSTEKLIGSLCSPFARKEERNARIAFLLFFSVEVFGGRRDQAALLTALTDFFRDFSTKFSCFQDMKPWLAYLDKQGQKQLLLDAAVIARGLRPQSGVSESSVIFWITSEINILKLEFYLVISQDENCFRSDLVVAFISTCLRLYKQSLRFGFDLPVSDRRPGDDAALLAAMGLVHLFKMGKRYALIQCILLLEHTLLHSKHNYDALLILVRLYMFIGAGSLAMERYNRLSIKNVQHATISWVLYTRLSTIHPFPATYTANDRTQTTIVPFQDMMYALDWHQSAQILSYKAVTSIQDRGAWNMSLDTLETNHAVFSGLGRYLLYVEVKRIERLLMPPRTIVKHSHRVPERTRDSRDSSAFPDFEAGQLTFEEHLPAVGTISHPDVGLAYDTWLQHQLHLTFLWELLQYGYSELSQAEIYNMEKRAGRSITSLTDSEQRTAELIPTIINLHNYYTSPDLYGNKAMSNFVIEKVDGLHSWVTKAIERLTSMIESGEFGIMSLTPDFGVPLWELYHHLFCIIEQCKFINAISSFVVAENKKKPSVDQKILTRRLKILQGACSELSGKVWSEAIAARAHLQNSSFLGRLTEIALGNSSEDTEKSVVVDALKDLGNQQELEKVCKDLKDSWVDGLNDILQVKDA
ncbi:hypothetical protein ACLMJK_005996 [Lecanora helva]